MHDLCYILISTVFYLRCVPKSRCLATELQSYDRPTNRDIVPDENFELAPLFRPAKHDAQGNVTQEAGTMDAYTFKKGVS